MAYCWKCGAQLYENSSFCQSCGAPAKPSQKMASGAQASGPQVSTGTPGTQTGFERLQAERGFQDHWIRRVIGYVIDVVLVSIVVYFIILVIALPALPGIFFGQTFPFAWFWGFWLGGISPLILIAYFVIADATYGRTIGKELMGLRVVKVNGRHVDLWSSLVRNISKIFFILLLIDLAVGLGTHGDGRQKYSDRYVGTTVEASNKMRIIPEHT